MNLTCLFLGHAWRRIGTKGLIEDNHRAAALALRAKLNADAIKTSGGPSPYWGAGRWVTSGIKGAGYAHVRVMEE